MYSFEIQEVNLRHLPVLKLHFSFWFSNGNREILTLHYHHCPQPNCITWSHRWYKFIINSFSCPPEKEKTLWLVVILPLCHNLFWYTILCVKSVRIQSFSGPYFPTFRLNTERYSVSLHIQSECEKLLTWKTPNTEIFHALFGISGCLMIAWILRIFPSNLCQINFWEKCVAWTVSI